MLVIPAIDMRGGKCVRLYEGDFRRETVYSDDPIAVAERWCEQGASVLHVIDLDGARLGSPQNLGAVESIVRRTGAAVQYGGGLRTEADVECAFRAGVKRVIMGTALMRSPALLEGLVRRYGPGVLAALDCRAGVVLDRGWTGATGVSLLDAAGYLLARGLSEFVYTDASRDGTLKGPDLDGVRALLKTGAGVIASGGVSRLGDIAALAELETDGLRGVIVGKALYLGIFSLGEATAVAGRRACGEEDARREVTGC